MHVKLNTSGAPGQSLEELFLTSSTVLPFRYKELEKHMKIRVFPQGPFYITFSNTKLMSNGTIIMDFNKNHLKYKVNGQPSNTKAIDESFLYEDFNEFTVNVKNAEIQFKKSDSGKIFSMFGNFSDFMFIGFCSFSPVKWTVQEGNPGHTNIITRIHF